MTQPPPHLDEAVQPVDSAYPRYGSYPRAPVQQALTTFAKLVRAFVIGNFWLAVVAIPILSMSIWMGATGQFDGNRDEDRSVPLETLILYIPFVLGFLIASICAKPKRLSPLFATLAGIPTGIMWLLFVEPSVGPGWALLLLLAFVALMCGAAIGFNRLLTKGQAAVPIASN